MNQNPYLPPGVSDERMAREARELVCVDHGDQHRFTPCDDHPATCTCGVQEYEED